MASVFGRAGHALFLDCRTLEIEHAAAARPSCACSSCTPASRARSKATPYAQRRAESIAVGDAARTRARCATRRFEQVRDDPRGRHAVTEMAAGARVRATRCEPATSTRSDR